MELIISIVLLILIFVILYKLSYLSYFNRAEIMFRYQSFWIGLHYSKQCERYCLNIIPCITIWWISKSGKPVNRNLM